MVHLAQIPDDSSLAVTARTQEGKLQFLVLHRPVTGEESLRRAILLDENAIEAHLLLWSLLQLTGRYEECESIFWRIYELTPPPGRAERLRDWYMSQFFPATVNDELDRRMGFVDEQTGSLPTEAIRCLRFRETEPEEPLGRATLARWTKQQGKPNEALSLLELGDANLDHELKDAFFVATLVDLLLELGEYERAEQYFQKWPGARKGYEYSRLEAVILEEAHEDYERALEAYDRALTAWPGPADWRLIHRKAGCLARAGKRELSVATRERADVVEQLMQNDVHKELRLALGFLDKPENLRKVAAFYEKLGRTRESRAWLVEVAGLVADSLD